MGTILFCLITLCVGYFIGSDTTRMKIEEEYDLIPKKKGCGCK